MIKNVIFDIGNVLMTFQPSLYFKDYFQDQEKSDELCNAVFTHEAWLQYDLGLYTMEDLHIAYKAAFPNLYNDLALILANWKTLMKPIPTSVALMKQLKDAGYQIFILSNLSEDSYAYLKGQSFFDYVDGKVLSFEEHLIKPCKEIYGTLLNRYSLCAKECLFIDDLLPNIKQAQNLGIHGVVYQEANQVKSEVYSIIEREAFHVKD